MKTFKVTFCLIGYATAIVEADDADSINFDSVIAEMNNLCLNVVDEVSLKYDDKGGFESEGI